MFVLSAVANSTYLASILAKSLGMRRPPLMLALQQLTCADNEYLLINLSWIIGSGGCVFLDFVVLAQFAAYARD